MSLARLVVIEGPDVGREFELPLRGGAVGRGEGCLVQLTDPMVSRKHGEIVLRDGALHWIDDQLDVARARTLINGKGLTAHPLESGDEIVLGSTKLAYLPVDGVAITRTAGHVTMEVGSRSLLALTGHDDRPRRQLAALAQLGDRLRGETAAGVAAVARATCEAALAILGGARAFVLAPGKRMAPIAALVRTSDDGTQLQVPHDIAQKLVAGKQVLTAEASGRQLIAAPICGATDEVVAILWVDRATGAWDATDALAAGCLAHLVGAAWASTDARDQLARRADAFEEQLLGPLANGDFVGKSAAAQKVRDFVHRVGPSDATVLLGGESGSGKEMVSRGIHTASRRAKGPFVAVNCAALTESLIESELFGHEKGAFTGATDRKAGRFEMADRGTIFLDEVGELPLGLQTKFLRVLEDKRFERVGGQRAIEVDTRVVAATNRDLVDMVKRGTFREDLYYRLAIIHIEVPPLRERIDDVPALADYFLARFRTQAARRITGFSPEAVAVMQRYHWPGNVRELRNAVERALVLGDQPQIVVDDLPPQMLAPRLDRVRASPTPSLGAIPIPAIAPPAPVAPSPVITIDMPSAPRPVARSLRELEKDGILAALAATHGNKAQAAAILEIDRSTLYKKLKDYEIET